MDSTALLYAALGVGLFTNTFFVTLNVVQYDVSKITALSAGSAVVCAIFIFALALRE